jgi:hypothetical protein
VTASKDSLPVLDTADVRRRMIELWEQVYDGTISGVQARIHIGIARTVLESLKVEIAAAHLSDRELQPVQMRTKKQARIDAAAA